MKGQFVEISKTCTSYKTTLLLLLPIKFIPQRAWVLSNLWYVHSPTRRHTIKNKIVIFTVKTMMWMFTHQQAPPWTVQVWEHLFSTAGKLFHVRIAEWKYAFWWLYILENGIWNCWSWPLVVLGVAGVRYICDGMAIRWTFEKSGVFCCCLIDWCWASLMSSQVWYIKLSKIFLEINMNYM